MKEVSAALFDKEAHTHRCFVACGAFYKGRLIAIEVNDSKYHSFNAKNLQEGEDGIKREEEKFNKAEKLTEWDGPVYCEGLGRDGYAANLEEMVEYYDEDLKNFPKYVWVCDSIQIYKLDLDDILQPHEEHTWEDFERGDAKGEAELEAAIKKFNELNKDLVYWEPNYKKALLVGEIEEGTNNVN